MLRHTIITLIAAAALLTGCDNKPVAKQTADDQATTAPTDLRDAKLSGEKVFKYQDPREGYKPRKGLCAVPPCDPAAPASGDKSEPQPH